MKTNDVLQENEMVKLWKELKVNRVEFQFSCGGDSMGDVSIKIYNESWETIDNSDLEDYFEDEVYENVTFYEVSDGYYLGEYGTVTITLNDDESDFVYDKESESEYEESVSETITVELSPEEKKLFDEKIRNIEVASFDHRLTVNYKDDCVFTDDDEVVLESLVERIKVLMDNVMFTEFDGEETDEGKRGFEMTDIYDNTLEINVMGMMYITRNENY